MTSPPGGRSTRRPRPNQLSRSLWSALSTELRAPAVVGFLLSSVLHTVACVALFALESPPTSVGTARADNWWPSPAGWPRPGCSRWWRSRVTRPGGDTPAVGFGVVLLLGGAFTVALAPVLRVPALLGAVLLGAVAAVASTAPRARTKEVATRGCRCSRWPASDLSGLHCGCHLPRLGLDVGCGVGDRPFPGGVHTRLAVAEERLGSPGTCTTCSGGICRSSRCRASWPRGWRPAATVRRPSGCSRSAGSLTSRSVSRGPWLTATAPPTSTPSWRGRVRCCVRPV